MLILEHQYSQKRILKMKNLMFGALVLSPEKLKYLRMLMV